MRTGRGGPRARVWAARLPGFRGPIPASARRARARARFLRRKPTQGAGQPSGLGCVPPPSFVHLGVPTGGIRMGPWGEAFGWE